MTEVSIGKSRSPQVGSADSAAPRDDAGRFRQLAETIAAFTWIADSEGHVRYVNDRWFDYTGIERDGREQIIASGNVHPDDAQRSREAWLHAVAHGTEHRLEVRIRRRDGMYRWFESRAVPLKDSSGRVTQWFGATTDIDERKRAEEIAAFMSRASSELAQLSDYRETLRRISDFAIPTFADWCGIFLTAEDGSVERLKVSNQDPERVRLLHAMRERYPYRPDDPIGPGKVLRTGSSCWSENMTEETLASFAHDATHLAMLKQLNFRSWVCVPIRLQRRIGGAMSFVMTDSGRVYSEAQLRVAEDLAHRVSIAIENHALVAALRDSDQRKSELLEQLREEHRRKDEFLAMLAHELRNPLAPIRNSVHILRAKGPPVPELEWARDVIDRQVQHMSRLVDDLLDVSRVSQGKIELRRDRMPLSAAVGSAMEACRPLIEESRHQLSVSMPMEPIHVDADPTRLSQVIANLINNATKYTDPPGRIWVNVDREGDLAVIRVRDNGIGIPPDMLARIFDVFTQVDRSLDRAQGGLGIGLTLARRLVEMHGGTLEAFSEGLGKGSEFTVRLPLLAQARARPQQEPEPVIASAGPRARVLVVDDNRDAADTLAVLLRSRGHEVRTAYDGVEGVGAASAFKPDVVLLDVGLPKLHGHDVAREIRRQRGASVLLIAITGLGQQEDRRLSKEAGFDHHLTKPASIDTLERLIAHAAIQ